MALSGDSSCQRNTRDSPETIDFTVPSPARMYNYYLGGKDHFPWDREAAERALSVVPSGRDLCVLTGISWSTR